MLSLAHDSDIMDIQINFNIAFIEVIEQIYFDSYSLYNNAKILKTYKEQDTISIFNI